MPPGFRLLCVCALGWVGDASDLVTPSWGSGLCWALRLKTTPGSRLPSSMAQVWKLRPREIG